MFCTGIQTLATPLIMLRCSFPRMFYGPATPRSLPSIRTGESAEQLLEIRDDLFLDLEERNFDTSQFASEARHPVPLDAAGRDLVEPREVGRHVEGEAVGGNAPGGELYSDSSNLAPLHPYPCVRRMPSRRQAIV